MSFDPTKFNPHDTEFLANPYPTYAEFRRQAPVCWVEPYKAYWVFRADDVLEILRNKDRYLKNQVQATPAAKALPPNPFTVASLLGDGIFSMDPPDHTRVRALVEPIFAAAIADAKDIATRKAKELLANATASRRIELVSAYAAPLPPYVLVNVLGLPDTHLPAIVGWVAQILNGRDVTSPLPAQITMGTCALALGAYFQAAQRGCPTRPREKRLLDGMVKTIKKKDGMTADEVQQTSINFAVAGYLSATFLIATGTLNLIESKQWALLRKNRGLMNDAIQEMLRYDAPAQLVDRYVAEDTELGGVKLRKNDKVIAVLGSANHDPGMVDRPDEFDITRKTTHVGFGAGIHRCIGAPLVESTLPAAFNVLLDTFEELKVDGLPQWQTYPYLRSVANLPLAIA